MLRLGRVQARPLQPLGRHLPAALMPVVMQPPALVALAVVFRTRPIRSFLAGGVAIAPAANKKRTQIQIRDPG